ncbi:MAG: hypothetical protein ACP5GJ_03755 [Nanopusillaceae archaeon]|jgi:hypothetical protein
MYRIYELCGKSDYSIRFDKKIDVKKVKEYFKDYEIIDENEETISLRKEEKNVIGFSYGEVILVNFNIEEVEKIAKYIDS